MYASIHRYSTSETRRRDPAEVGWRLGNALGQSPGFVAAIVLIDAAGALTTITLFEDAFTLSAAMPLTERWITEHRDALEPGAIEVAVGEVVAQKGL